MVRRWHEKNPQLFIYQKPWLKYTKCKLIFGKNGTQTEKRKLKHNSEVNKFSINFIFVPSPPRKMTYKKKWSELNIPLCQDRNIYTINKKKNKHV